MFLPSLSCEEHDDHTANEDVHHDMCDDKQTEKSTFEIQDPFPVARRLWIGFLSFIVTLDHRYICSVQTVQKDNFAIGVVPLLVKKSSY